MAIGAKLPEIAGHCTAIREFRPSAVTPQVKLSCGAGAFCRADYIIAVKNNQPSLAQAIEGSFESALRPQQTELPQGINLDKGPCPATHAPLCGVHRFERAGQPRRADPGVTLDSLTPAEFNRQIQDRWYIKYGCHSVLDMVFDEDASHARRDHSAEHGTAAAHDAQPDHK